MLYWRLQEQWAGSSRQLEYSRFNTLNKLCLAIAIWGDVSIMVAVGEWNSSCYKPIEKNAFPLHPGYKRKSVIHLHAYKELTSGHFLNCMLPCTVKNIVFNSVQRCTYQPGLWWCSLQKTEAYMGSCWKRRWPLESQSCTACGLADSGLPLGAGPDPGGAGRCPRCRHTSSTLPVQAGTSCRWRCRRYRCDRQSPVARSTPVRARFHSQWRWHCAAQKEQLQTGGEK